MSPLHYLDALDAAWQQQLPGHYATERFGVEELAERSGREWPEVTAFAIWRESDPVLLV